MLAVAGQRHGNDGIRPNSSECDIGPGIHISGGMVAAVEERSAAPREIARNVQPAAHCTLRVSENITGVSHSATETGTAAGQVLGAAGELSHQAELLRTELGKFIDCGRAV